MDSIRREREKKNQHCLSVHRIEDLFLLDYIPNGDADCVDCWALATATGTGVSRLIINCESHFLVD